jgi:hypothetical protein
VLASIIEAEIAIFEAGIAHLNVESWKALILPSPKLFVLVDFNLSVVYNCFEFASKILL